MTEQAYHARGAGRVSLTETELEILLAGRFGLGHDLVGNVEILWLTQQLNKLIAAHQGEPGADTGTTPPPSTAEFEPLLRGELKHGRSCPAVGAPMDEGNCDCGLKWRIRLQTEMTLRNAWEKRAYEAEAALAAAERGTTPPEGLAFTFEEFIDMSLRHNKRLAAGISGIASFGHWYNELAATQRAPVEQGRDELQELKLSSEGGRSGSSHPVTLLSSPSPASADHAREGALELDYATFAKEIAQIPVDLHGIRWSSKTRSTSIKHDHAAIVEVLKRVVLAARADGKEGGE